MRNDEKEAQGASPPETQLEWLKHRSMLLKHDSLSEIQAGRAAQWRHPFGRARPAQVLGDHSVWFAAYPDSLIGPPGAKPLDILGSPRLHGLLARLGISGIHTGPMKRSGSVAGTAYGASVDGHFDRIESVVDPDYGSESGYRDMIGTAAEHGIAVVGDLIPGHTGIGPDFRLATLNEPGFPGLYTMIEIGPEDWPLLPPVPEGQDSVNLSQTAVRTLKHRGYAPVGPLDIEVFARPGIKESCWSATDVVRGVDGRDRRWVYLHVFKQGQPSLNWSDPSYAAHRLMTADLLHSLTVLGAGGLRLDATMFLGIEAGAAEQASWLGGHPLSNRVTEQLSTTIRKFGGFSFQELNTDLERLRSSLDAGPEFNYDFFTRPGYLYALARGDGGPLRLMLRELLRFGIQPMRLVHGLQNHDELMLETTHLSVNGNEQFEYEGNLESGESLFRRTHEEVIATTAGDGAPYNRVFAMSPGVCSTMTGFIAAALGLRDLDEASGRKQEIVQVHLLAAAFNALQGGVFLVSGWDLAGALPVPDDAVRDLVADGDYRWINRGGYDLLGTAAGKRRSARGLPRARALYGSLTEQLDDEDSFASRLMALIRIREALGVARSELLSVPEVDHDGVVVLANRLPERGRVQITALNFGAAPVAQQIRGLGLHGDAEVQWSSIRGAVSTPVRLRGDSLAVALGSREAQLIVARNVDEG